MKYLMENSLSIFSAFILIVLFTAILQGANIFLSRFVPGVWSLLLFYLIMPFAAMGLISWLSENILSYLKEQEYLMTIIGITAFISIFLLPLGDAFLPVKDYVYHVTHPGQVYAEIDEAIPDRKNSYYFLKGAELKRELMGIHHRRSSSGKIDTGGVTTHDYYVYAIPLVSSNHGSVSSVRFWLMESQGFSQSWALGSYMINQSKGILPEGLVLTDPMDRRRMMKAIRNAARTYDLDLDRPLVLLKPIGDLDKFRLSGKRNVILYLGIVLLIWVLIPWIIYIVRLSRANPA